MWKNKLAIEFKLIRLKERKFEGKKRQKTKYKVQKSLSDRKMVDFQKQTKVSSRQYEWELQDKKYSVKNKNNNNNNNRCKIRVPFMSRGNF